MYQAQDVPYIDPEQDSSLMYQEQDVGQLTQLIQE